jgi:anti-sigma-K factor RskA
MPVRVSRYGQPRVVTGQGLLSAGLLTPDAQGSANETIKTPTDIPQPVAMAVAIEPLGGSPGTDGGTVLGGGFVESASHKPSANER